MSGFFTLMIVYWLTRMAYVAVRTSVGRPAKGGTEMILLNLPRPATVTPAPQKSLCLECKYSHVVRGFEPHEEIIVCGFAFPPREMFFSVRECTDFRAEGVRTEEFTTLAL
jgi:predicted nucleic acid-binding Zn ribbon protein